MACESPCASPSLRWLLVVLKRAEALQADIHTARVHEPIELEQQARATSPVHLNSEEAEVARVAIVSATTN